MRRVIVDDVERPGAHDRCRIWILDDRTRLQAPIRTCEDRHGRKVVIEQPQEQQIVREGLSRDVRKAVEDLTDIEHAEELRQQVRR